MPGRNAAQAGGNPISLEILHDRTRNAMEGQEQSLPVVLIVEDEEPIAQALAFIVEDNGYGVHIASNGKRALEWMETRRPALIITDLMMPELNGADLIVSIRAGAARTHQAAPPIVLMSAAGKQHVNHADADAVLLKPFDLSQVEALLSRFMAPAEDE